MIDCLRYSPLTKKALAEAAGVSTREVEALIQQYRLEGWPILSDSDGYRLSNDPAEVLACSQRLRRRAIHQLLTSRALRRTARRMAAPQIELPWAA